MILKKVFCIFLFLLTCNSSFAQKNLKEGFIILNGDTVKGFINYKGTQRGATSINFRQEENGADKKYTPIEISGYGLTKEMSLFESKLVPPADSASALQMRFLNVLVKGRASLFYYQDSTGNDKFFLLKENQPLTVLEIREYTRQDPNTYKTFKVESRVFLGTLSNALNDCQEQTIYQLENVKLTANSLTNVISKYNKCVDPSASSYEQVERKAKVSFGLVATYFRSALKFSGESYLSEASFKREGVPAGGGISLNFAIPRVHDNLSIHAELLYVPGRFTTTVMRNTNSAFAYNQAVEFDLAYLKLPVQLRYTSPRGAIRPYVNAGVVMGYAIKNGNKATKTSSSSGAFMETTPALLPHQDGFRSYLQGYTMGAGLSKPIQQHALSLEARYEGNNGFSYFKEVGSTLNTFYLLLGYSF